MLAILQRQLDGTLEAMRLVDGEDHLQRGPAVVDAAPGLAVLLDGVEQVLDDPLVAQAEAAVLEYLRLAEAGARDRLPLHLAALAPAGTLREECRRETARRRGNDAPGAVDPQAEALARAELRL